MAVNLLPWRKKYYQYQRKQFFQLFVIFTLIPLIIMGVLIVNKKHFLNIQEKMIASMSRQLGEIKGQDQLFPKNSKNDRMLAAINFYETSKKQFKNTLDILNIIVSRIPPQTVLTEVQKLEDELLLKGRANTQEELANFFKELSALNFDLKTLDNSGEATKTELNFSASYKLKK